MKRVFKMVAVMLLISTSAHAGLWEKMTTLGQPTIKPESEYLVEASGWNLRVYEWTPPENRNIRCFFAAGEQKGGAACYPVGEKAQQ